MSARQKPLIWKGERYLPGPISEWVYEDFIDVAYGRGGSLKDTAFYWNDEYVRGFWTPSEDGDYIAFAVDRNDRCHYLGRFTADELFGTEEPDWEDVKWDLYDDADRLNDCRGIAILRDIYFDPREAGNRTPEVDKIAMDDECIRWYCDYWDFVTWNEHGNEANLTECSTMPDIANAIHEPEYILEYLDPDGNFTRDDDPELYDRMKRLAERLVYLHQKHGGY